MILNAAVPVVDYTIPIFGTITLLLSGAIWIIRYQIKQSFELEKLKNKVHDKLGDIELALKKNEDNIWLVDQKVDDKVDKIHETIQSMNDNLGRLNTNLEHILEGRLQIGKKSDK